MKDRRAPYEAKEVAGQYRVLERAVKINKNTKFRVRCLKCNGVMYRFSNKFEKNHRDCAGVLQ